MRTPASTRNEERMQFVDLHAQYLAIRKEIDSAIQAVISESAFIRGHHVRSFEQRFATATGRQFCVSCGNGTDALYIALRALRVTPGDEVITTAHSWIATSEAISQAGAQVVFCDTEPDMFCIHPDQVRSKISPRTVGIIPVHLYGQPAAMSAILDIANRHGLWVIEDCAQAHFATHHGRQVGTFGHIGTFSFYPGKNLGAMGDAGCLVTDDAEIADFARHFSEHGGKNAHCVEGINSRMDGLQAAILNVKLSHIGKWTEARQRIADLYDDRLRRIPPIRIPTRRHDCEHVFHQYVVKLDQRDQLRSYLLARDIPTSISYPEALPFLPAYRHFRHRVDDFPIAYHNARSILSLPIYPELLDQCVFDVARAIEDWSRSIDDAMDQRTYPSR